MAPQLIQVVTSGAVPAAPPGSPNLRWHPWPLYSCFALDAAAIPKGPIEVFNYLAGSAIPGAGAAVTAANLMHTNMAAIRTVAAPKVNIVTSIRIVVPPITFTPNPALDDATSGATNSALDQVDDLTKIIEAMAVEFKVGEKFYAQGPIWAMPANTGLGGIVSTSVVANAAILFQNQVAIFKSGIPWDFSSGQNPVLWAGQTLRFAFLCDFTTQPVALTDTHLVYAVLDTVQGSELQ